MAIIVIPRSQVTDYVFHYEVQEQARNGTWNTVLATDDKDFALTYAEHKSALCGVRIINNRI